ncbi:MAG: toxin-antitoxin system antitoxin subunit [Ancrocorticia sp.]
MERKMSGREISEAEVDAWVAEAEQGYAVEELQTRRISGTSPNL